MNHLPSSWEQQCWGRSWRAQCTQTRATPQSATVCTGRSVCSGACSGSSAWRWWQSQCKPSDGEKMSIMCEKMMPNYLNLWNAVTAPYLILLQTALLNHLVTLLLESDDDKSHKDVDEEEWEDHKIDHIENWHLHPVPPTRPHVLLCNICRVLEDPTFKKIILPVVDSFIAHISYRKQFCAEKNWAESL